MEGKLSKKKLKLLNRLKVAELKAVCARPEVVEVWDVTGPDPPLLVFLKVGVGCGRGVAAGVPTDGWGLRHWTVPVLWTSRPAGRQAADAGGGGRPRMQQLHGTESLCALPCAVESPYITSHTSSPLRPPVAGVPGRLAMLTRDPTPSCPALPSCVAAQAYRNTVPVPRHWSQKRKYLQGKRGLEKPPFQLPDFIEATGIAEMRSAYQVRQAGTT